MGEGAVDTEPANTVERADALVARGEVRNAVDLLTDANRRKRSSDLERALVRVRHEGCGRLPPPPPARSGGHVVADGVGGDLVEVAAADLTPAIVRRGFERNGCVLVRGLVPPERAQWLAAGIDTVFDAYDASVAGEPFDPEWYTPFPMPDVISPGDAERAVVLSPGAPPASRLPSEAHRKLTRRAAGIWTVDSPRMLYEVFELVEDIGIGAIITELLGERPFLSANKCVLRRVPAEIMEGGWHQDGAFLGKDIGAFNFWLSLSSCGLDAPGLDLVPRRFDDILESGNEGAIFKWSLSDDDVAVAAAGVPIARPLFEPGDALLFDHRLVHRTATSPDMTLTRHAIEAWFLAPSAFPPSQLPLVY